MTNLKRLLFLPQGGMFREFFGVKTYLEPKDHSLYRRLLPEPFSMPDLPIVVIFVADYAKVFPWPMTRYREWAVALKSIYKGEEGWHVITMPVTKWVPMLGGRYLGFPKYIAEEITLTRDGENWKAQGRHKGVLQLTLEFQPGKTRQLAQWEKEQLENEAFFPDYVHQLVPSGRGPRVQKVRLVHMIPPKWAPVLGMVRISVDRSETWAELVPDEIMSPGVFNHFKGGINLVPGRPI